MSEYKLEYPKPNGNTSDRSLAYNENDPDMFKILTYWGYSKTGEYYAIESTWKFIEHEERVRLHLESVRVKYPHVAWFRNDESPEKLISDIHLRLAREQYRIRKKKHRCDYLILTPSAEFYEETSKNEV